MSRLIVFFLCLILVLSKPAYAFQCDDAETIIQKEFSSGFFPLLTSTADNQTIIIFVDIHGNGHFIAVEGDKACVLFKVNDLEAIRSDDV